MTKRVLTALLSVAILLTVVLSCAFSALADEVPAFDESKPYIKATSEPVKPGEIATVTFEVGNNTGFWGMRHTFTFDQEVLSLVPAETNQYGTFPQVEYGKNFSNSLVSPISNGDLIFLYTCVGTTDISTNKNNGMLFSVNFKVAENAKPGTYNIDLKDYSAKNVLSMSGKAVNFTYNQACVTVYDLNHTHDYTEKIIKEPTCTEEGEKILTCSICNESVTESIDALGHTEVIDEAREASCTEVGLTEGKHCSVCGEVLVKQEEIPMLPHTEVIDEARAASCSEVGLTEGKHCSVCNKVLVKQEEIPMLPHTEVIDKGREPTCSEPGLTEGKHCSVCNKVLVEQEEIPMLNHTFTSEVIKEPTCTEKGEAVLNCTICGEKRIEELAALGHTEVVDAAVPATCLKTGLTEGKHCSVCGEILVKQQTVKQSAHRLITKNAKKATCFAKGYSGDKYCTVCKNTVYKGKATAKLKLKAPKLTVKSGKKQFKVSYKKAKYATGYQVKYKIGKKTVIKTYKSKKAATKTYKKLKKGSYKVYVRAMAKKGSKKVYSSWSKAKKIKVR